MQLCNAAALSLYNQAFRAELATGDAVVVEPEPEHVAAARVGRLEHERAAELAVAHAHGGDLHVRHAHVEVLGEAREPHEPVSWGDRKSNTRPRE